MTVDSESEAAADLDADADARKTSCADASDFHIESCILRRFAFQYSHFRLCKTETGLVIVTGIIVIACCQSDCMRGLLHPTPHVTVAGGSMPNICTREVFTHTSMAYEISIYMVADILPTNSS